MEHIIYQFPVEDPYNGFKVIVYEGDVLSGYPRKLTGKYHIQMHEYESSEKQTEQYWVHKEDGTGFFDQEDVIEKAKKWYGEKTTKK